MCLRAPCMLSGLRQMRSLSTLLNFLNIVIIIALVALATTTCLNNMLRFICRPLSLLKFYLKLSQRMQMLQTANGRKGINDKTILDFTNEHGIKLLFPWSKYVGIMKALCPLGIFSVFIFMQNMFL